MSSLVYVLIMWHTYMYNTESVNVYYRTTLNGCVPFIYGLYAGMHTCSRECMMYMITACIFNWYNYGYTVTRQIFYYKYCCMYTHAMHVQDARNIIIMIVS